MLLHIYRNNYAGRQLHYSEYQALQNDICRAKDVAKRSSYRRNFGLGIGYAQRTLSIAAIRAIAGFTTYRGEVTLWLK